MPRPSQFQQEAPAGHVLGALVGPSPIPLLTKFQRQPGASPGWILSQQLLDQLNIRWLYLSALYYRYILHGRDNNRAWCLSPAKITKNSKKFFQPFLTPASKGVTTPYFYRKSIIFQHL